MKKLTIIGAGSTYTPELLEGLTQFKDSIEVNQIMLYDIDEKRLEIMCGFLKRYAKTLDYKTEFVTTTDLKEAVIDAEFLITQIRVGGNKLRVLDEKIPLKYDLIGQETTGIGGFMKALRTIPVMLEIAKAVEKYSPDCWIINYTNPTGLIAEALTKYTSAKIAGFCSGGIFPKMWASKALGIEHHQLKYDFAGLNHMNFSYNLSIDGKPVTDEEFEKIAKENHEINLELMKELKCIPSPYLQYYYHTEKKLDGFKNAEKTRGEQVMELEEIIYEEYADTTNVNKPKTLKKRGGGGYSEVAIGFINAVHNNCDTEMVINVPNNGAIPFLPDDAVVEINCLVNGSGVYPIVKNNLPKAVRGLISEVKNYEQLAVEAAVSKDYNLAKLALLAHPLVRQYEKIETVFNELLKVNEDYVKLEKKS